MVRWEREITYSGMELDINPNEVYFGISGQPARRLSIFLKADKDTVNWGCWVAQILLKKTKKKPEHFIW